MNDETFLNSKISAACLIFLAAVAFTVALKFTKVLVMPFVIALLIYTIMTPLIRFLVTKAKMPRWTAVALVFIVVTAVSVLCVVFIYNSIDSFVAGADIYKHKVLAIMNWALEILKKLDVHINPDSITDIVGKLPVFNFVRGVGNFLISLTTTFVLAVIFLLFLFIGSHRKNDVADGGETKKEKHENHTVKGIQDRISFYIILKTAISFATGVLTWIILWLFGVELAFMFGLLAFLLNYIPNVGSITAVILPVPVIFLQFGFGPQLVVCMCLLIAMQFTLGGIVEPKILGDGIDLHPVAVVCALIFWALVWGVPGAFLAVPLTVAIKEVLSRISLTKPFAEVLAGRVDGI